MSRLSLVGALALSALVLGACGAPTPPASTAAPPPTAAPAPPTATTAPPTPSPVPATPTTAPTATTAPATPTTASLPTIAAAVPTLAPAGAGVSTPSAGGAVATAGTDGIAATPGTGAEAGPSPAAGGPRGVASARAAGLDPDAVAAAFSGVKSFRASIKGDQAGQTIDGTIEVVLPDKLHISATNLIGAGQAEMIAIGNDAYIKSGGTDWVKMEGAGGMANLASLTNPSEISGQLVGPDAQVTKGPSITVRGEPCQQYTTVDQGQTVQFCIGSDNLPHQILAQGLTIEFYDYNAPITIEAPAAAQSMPTLPVLPSGTPGA